MVSVMLCKVMSTKRKACILKIRNIRIYEITIASFIIGTRVAYRNFHVKPCDSLCQAASIGIARILHWRGPSDNQANVYVYMYYIYVCFIHLL